MESGCTNDSCGSKDVVLISADAKTHHSKVETCFEFEVHNISWTMIWYVPPDKQLWLCQHSQLHRTCGCILSLSMPILLTSSVAILTPWQDFLRKCRCFGQLLGYGWGTVWRVLFYTFSAWGNSVLATMWKWCHNSNTGTGKYSVGPRPSLWLSIPNGLCWHMPVMTKMANMTVVRKLQLWSSLGLLMISRRRTWGGPA